MNFPRMLFLPFAVSIGLGMVSCASNENENLSGALVLEKAFVHRGLKIKAWKIPEMDGSEAERTKELHMLVSGPGWQPKRWVKLRQGQSFEGLKLESLDIRGDAIETPNGGLIPLLIRGFSLKIEDGVPKPFLILRDFCGDAAVAFYSDEANPPFKHRGN
jgi:hypothetical protein